ncbi:MAG: ion transporter [Methylococcales bacterium]|nr:ion transporter [Methylococcales bacterium]
MIKLRQWLFDLLERPQAMPVLSANVNRFLIGLIFFNIGAATLESVPEFSQSYASAFLLIESVSIVIFTFEYFLRVWISIEAPGIKSRFTYLFTANAVIDFISIAPFYLSLVLGLDLTAFVVLRLLRLLKLVRYFAPLAVLGTALKAEFNSFVSALFILFILLMVASSGMYFLERHVQPEVFGNIPQAMWWAVVTLTTMGYGDVVPLTAQGKVFASVITILSIGTVALPAGMLASRFSEELKNRKAEFKGLAIKIQKDGDLCEQSRNILEEYRQDLCLGKEEAQKLIEYACTKGSGICPECGQKINTGEGT